MTEHRLSGLRLSLTLEHGLTLIPRWRSECSKDIANQPLMWRSDRAWSSRWSRRWLRVVCRPASILWSLLASRQMRLRHLLLLMVGLCLWILRSGRKGR